MERKNLAVELLKRLLNDEIKTRGKLNLVQSKKFSEMLAEAIRRYQNGLIDSATVLEFLFGIARKYKEDDQLRESLGLEPDEYAFYTALAENPSAQSLMKVKKLRKMAKELANHIRKNTSIDWQLKSSVQAELRVLVKRLLRKYKYPPDDPSTGEYKESVKRVLDQAGELANYWTSKM